MRHDPAPSEGTPHPSASRSPRAAERLTGLALACPDEAAFVRCDDRLGTVAKLELREDPTDACAHSRLADEELRCDLGVRQAARDELQDAELALAELGHGNWLRIARRRTPDELVDHPLHDLGRDVDVTARSRAHRGYELGRRCFLEQKPARSGLHRVVDVFVGIECRQHQHPSVCAGGGQSMCRLDPVNLGHPHVHQHDVGLERASGVGGRRTVAGPADDLEVGLDVEDHPKPGADEVLIVWDEDADHASGIDARTRKAPAVSRTASRLPPYRETRSRIPRRPCPVQPPASSRTPSFQTSTSRRSSV